MKTIINWFKDLFYNATDYAIILCVIAVVAVVLFWRFDILFNLKLEKDAIKPNPIVISDSKDVENTDPSNNEPNDSSGNESQGGETNTPPATDPNNPDSGQKPEQPEQGNTQTPANEGAEVSFNIPAGTFPGKIADILIDKALIEDKQKFLDRSVELKLDTKLKSGDFKIKKGTSLDDVIKIIAKQN